MSLNKLEAAIIDASERALRRSAARVRAKARDATVQIELKSGEQIVISTAESATHSRLAGDIEHAADYLRSDYIASRDAENT